MLYRPGTVGGNLAVATSLCTSVRSTMRAVLIKTHNCAVQLPQALCGPALFKRSDHRVIDIMSSTVQESAVRVYIHALLFSCGCFLVHAFQRGPSAVANWPRGWQVYPVAVLLVSVLWLCRAGTSAGAPPWICRAFPRIATLSIAILTNSCPASVSGVAK